MSTSRSYSTVKSSQGLNEYEEDQAENIEIAISNEYESYRQLMAFNENYMLKKKRGVFDKKLAQKGLLNVVRTAITFINKSRHWNHLGTVSQKVKDNVAKELLRQLWEDHGLREVRKAPPKSKGKRGKVIRKR